MVILNFHNIISGINMKFSAQNFTHFAHAQIAHSETFS